MITNFFLLLQKDQEKMKSIRDKEERLIVTAWYNMVRNTEAEVDEANNVL